MPLYTEHPRKADSPCYCHTDMGIPSPHYFHKAVEYPAYGKHYRIYFHYITPKIRIDRISGSYTYVCIYYITFFTIRQGLDKMIFVCYNANRTFVRCGRTILFKGMRQTNVEALVTTESLLCCVYIAEHLFVMAGYRINYCLVLHIPLGDKKRF